MLICNWCSAEVHWSFLLDTYWCSDCRIDDADEVEEITACDDCTEVEDPAELSESDTPTVIGTVRKITVATRLRLCDTE